jgi:hypothetical protein
MTLSVADFVCSDDNKPVRRSSTIWITTIFALLLAALVPQAEAVWQCDGRTCGTALCCCVSSDGVNDPNCKVSTGPVSGAAGCSSNCRCVLVSQALNAARTEQVSSFTAPVFHRVLLPAAPAAVAPLPTEIVARCIQRRGPPPCRVALASPSLRAPPYA